MHALVGNSLYERFKLQLANKFVELRDSDRQDKRERRSETHERLLYYVNVNRTSLDHLLLGERADGDKMSRELSIARDR